MIILKTTEKLNIVVDEKDMMAGVKNYKIQFLNRMYDSVTYECISEETNKKLYTNLRQEYLSNKDEADKEFDKIYESFSGAKKEESSKTETKPLPSGGALEDMFVKLVTEKSVDGLLNMTKPMISDWIKKEFGALPMKHEVNVNGVKHEFKGVTHEKFEDVLKLVSLDIPAFLSGGAGTGKNVICKQVAEAMGLDFYFTNAVTQEYQLKGFIDANGTYHGTQFYEAFTKGGLFFLDEIDGSIPETLIILNSAIANKYFDFPIGRLYAHPDFRVIAAGNTFGTGADIEYTGRFQLDASSLDRFALVNIDYSPAIEDAISGGNKELCEFARKYRQITSSCGIKSICSYRAIERITKLEDMFELKDIMKMSLTKGLGNDDLNVIRNWFKKMGFKNKYTEAI